MYIVYIVYYEMYIGWCLGAYNDNYLTFNVYL